MTRRWSAQLVSPDRTRFTLWAPDRDAVTLEIDGNASIAMTAAEDGWFEAEAPVGAGARYLFRVDPDLTVPDPASRAQSGGIHGWSVVIDHDAYRWSVGGWRGRPWHETVIEEVHVGLEGGFAALVERLTEIAALGVTAIELMPVNAFGGMRNWGYDGVLPYAPAERYGTPDELKALIDRAHALGLIVLLDVVYNHFGPDGNYLGAYASGFFDAEVKTPWGGAVAVDRPEVARFFIDNALMWLEDYRFDGLRFDAVHALANNGFLDAMAREIRETLGPDRHIHLILENERNDAARLADGLYDAQWNDDFHNVLHVLLTGETTAYYQDFADCSAARLARCLSDGFIYQGEPSPNHDGAPRGTPSSALPPSAFVAFLQNHDQIGNRALGERLTLLTGNARLRAATVLLLLGPQIPLIFMGDTAGSRTPFLFFTDFHDELADAVREGRRKEFAKFAAFSDLKARERIPDPNAKTTFDASQPQPGPDAVEWRALYRRLLTIRHAEIVPHLVGARAIDAEVIGDAAVVARWRLTGDRVLTIAINLGDTAVTFPDVGNLLYGEGEPGSAGSAAAWLDTP